MCDTLDELAAIVHTLCDYCDERPAEMTTTSGEHLCKPCVAERADCAWVCPECGEDDRITVRDEGEANPIAPWLHDEHIEATCESCGHSWHAPHAIVEASVPDEDAALDAWRDR